MVFNRVKSIWTTIDLDIMEKDIVPFLDKEDSKGFSDKGGEASHRVCGGPCL